MGLFSSSSSKSTTLVSETNTDNSQTNPQGQNVVSGGVGASDFAQATNVSITASKSGVNLFDAGEGLLLSGSSNNTISITQMLSENGAVTEDVVKQYVSGATQEQITQTYANTANLFIKAGVIVAGAFILWQIVKKK